MNTFQIVGALLGTAFTLVAQEGPQRPDPMTAAWQSLSATQRGWQADWNKATGTPRAVYGPGLRVAESLETLAEARAAASRLLEEQSQLLGRGGSQFDEVIGQQVGNTFLFVYDQRFQGALVIGGRADVQLKQNGVAAMFGATAVQIPASFSMEPQVSEQAAILDAYRAQRAEPTVRPATELVIYADTEGAEPAQPRLAWQVQVDDRRPNEAEVYGKMYIDALNGSVLHWENEVYTCSFGHTHYLGGGVASEEEHTVESTVDPLTARLNAAMAKRASLKAEADLDDEALPMTVSGTVMGYVNITSNNLSSTTNVPLPGIRVAVPGAPLTFTDDQGNFSVNVSGTTPVSVQFRTVGRHLSNMRNFNGTTLVQSVSITPGVPATIQFSSPNANEFERSQLDVYWWTDQVNEYFRGLLGNTSQLNAASQITADVNENSTCNASYGGNNMNYFRSGSGCNNTGFSTVVSHEWGHGIDDRYGGISQTDGLSEAWGDTIAMFQTGQPVVGQGFSGTGGIIRTGLNNQQYPPSGGVHQQGQVFMGFNWRLRSNLIQALGPTAGVARAEAIVLGSIAADATNQIDAVRAIFVLDDDDGNLNNGTPNYASLEAAALSRNIPFPELQVGDIQFTPLSRTTEELVPQEVVAQVTENFGSFTNVQLVYTVNNRNTLVDMVPTGNANEYRALIPGVLFGDSVDYRIQASHDSGRVVRMPETGTFRYDVSSLTSVFRDDFEGGTNGWTSQQLTRQDDWQFGAPAGRSGTSSGVAWQDPTAAFSGTRCRGNDLGIGNFNGAYQPNVSNRLISPVINVAGETGLVLRFKRWLTVEEGIFDQAQILVNNQVAWANPLNGNLVDTGWTDFELPIDQFVNGASTVRVIFTLITDGGLNLGGWAIDDFEILAQQATQPLDMQLQNSAPNVNLGATQTIALFGTPNAPAALLLSAQPGPTSFPGLPTLAVGSTFDLLPLTLNFGGAAILPIPAPTDPAASGLLLYWQAVQLDGSTLEVSNPSLTLIGN